MWERIITALVLVVVVALCMFASKSYVPMLGLMTLAALGAGFEWSKMMPTRVSHQSSSRLLAWGFGACNAILVVLSFYYLKDIWMFFWLASIAIWLLSLYWIRRFPQHDGWYNQGLYCVGVLLIVAAVTAIMYLWKLSPWWLLYVFFLVWGADSGAYFVGRQLGKRKLAPAVSPNKSIEGLIGGLFTSMLIILTVIFQWLELSVTVLVSFFILSLLTVVASVLGDLLESMIKRRAGVKDSGDILPGHGGVLDRIDSLLAAMPVFAVGMYIFKVMGLDI